MLGAGSQRPGPQDDADEEGVNEEDGEDEENEEGDVEAALLDHAVRDHEAPVAVGVGVVGEEEGVEGVGGVGRLVGELLQPEEVIIQQKWVIHLKHRVLTMMSASSRTGSPNLSFMFTRMRRQSKEVIIWQKWVIHLQPRFRTSKER